MSAMPEALRIQGRGPVAMALALFLSRQGFERGSMLIDPHAGELPPWLASRSLALSLGSWQLLSRIVVLPPAAPITTVEVSLRGHAGRTRMHASDLHAPALGYVLRYGALHRALAAAITSLRPSMPPERGAPPDSVVPDRDARTGYDAHAELLTIVADGDPGTDSQVRDFDQTALLSEIVAERDAHGTAFERFTDEGPLALLPLPEAHRHALVWCARPAQSERRAGMEAHAFEAELRDAFGGALGALRLHGERVLAPLQRRVRVRDDDARRIAIGNAAQALHPVAGQGLNLGLRDAFELARLLGELRAAGRPLVEAVAHYRRRRRTDRGAAVALTDTLARAFTLPALARVESVALAALDLFAPARDGLASTLMFGLRTR
jgi:2-octaprenyl-6-methoxyphenol hydroxylase